MRSRYPTFYWWALCLLLPTSYLFSHIFIVGLWCGHDRVSILPVIAFIVVLAITVLLDIIQLGIYFGPLQPGSSTWQFSADVYHQPTGQASDSSPCLCCYLFSSGRQCAQPAQEPQGLLHSHPWHLSDTVESQKQTIYECVYIY